MGIPGCLMQVLALKLQSFDRGLSFVDLPAKNEKKCPDNQNPKNVVARKIAANSQFKPQCMLLVRYRMSFWGDNFPKIFSYDPNGVDEIVTFNMQLLLTSQYQYLEIYQTSW